MNDAWGYDDNDNEQGAGHNDGPKALRDAYKALKEQNEVLNSKLTSFLEDQGKQKLSSVFESLGVPDAAKLYTGDADPDKARAWAESMKATFGGTQGVTPETTPIQPPAPALTPDQQQQFQTMNEAGQNGTPMGNIQAAEAAIGAATSIEDLIRISAQTQHLR